MHLEFSVMYLAWRVKTHGNTLAFRVMYLVYPIMHTSLNFPTLTVPSLAATIMNPRVWPQPWVYTLRCVNYNHFPR